MSVNCYNLKCKTETSEETKEKARNNTNNLIKSNKLEKEYDDFIIGFVEWKDKNCFVVMGSENLFYVRDSQIYNNAYTSRELLEIYNNNFKTKYY